MSDDVIIVFVCSCSVFGESLLGGWNVDTEHCFDYNFFIHEGVLVRGSKYSTIS